MADMIKFYKGLVGSLPATGVNGALYVTTDEGAIYLGTGTGMKRLGDFVQVANVASLPEKAHESCLYYCVAENILAKWNGTEWKQVNKQPTTEELKTLLGLGSLAYLSEVAESNLNADLATKINAASGAQHTHTNKALLDTYTQTEADLADAVAKKHAHTFVESELNKIADGDVAKWNAAEGNAKSYVDDKVAALDYTDTAVAGEYVSAVNEVDGKISVTRTALPDYSNTYDAKGAAATAESNAKSYADGLAANYDAKGTAAGVKTELEAEIAKKVDKVDGKSLVADSEITKLAGVSEGANKVEASTTNGNIKIDGVETVVYTHPEKHAIADVTGLQDALDAKVAQTAYNADKATFALKTEVEAVDAKFASYNTTVAQKAIDDAQDARIKAIEDTYLVEADIVDFETKENVQKVADDLANEVKAREEADTAINDKIGTVTEGKTVVQMISEAQTAATYDDSEVRGLISDNAEAIATEKERAEGIEGGLDTRIKAIEDDYLKAADKTELEGKITAEETRAKGVEESLQTQINTIMNNPDAEGAINSINEFTQYVTEHGTIADGFRTDIDKNKEDIAANTKAIADQATSDAATYETKTDAAQKLVDAKAYADGVVATEKSRAEGKEAELAAAIATAKTEASSQDAAVLSEAQSYADSKATAAQTAAEATAASALASARTEISAEIDADVKALADNVYTKAEVDALFTWGSF